MYVQIMNQIVWVDKDSVGIPSIDAQHKQLVGITNKLFVAIMHDEGERVLQEVLNELADYAEQHFAYEEKLFNEHGYPEDKRKSHTLEHRALTRQVHEFIEEAEAEPATLDIKVFGFLREWMTCHLSKTDSQYSAFLLAKGVRQPPPVQSGHIPVGISATLDRMRPTLLPTVPRKQFSTRLLRKYGMGPIGAPEQHTLDRFLIYRPLRPHGPTGLPHDNTATT
eukprot:TRINITY_DN10262_c0_g5_i1.p3 TRINITY_DN10262_c0_g5~~TRINITY_DN10262_c0_g5_i1.p3  ORF type:complete len:223 (-),score=26.42 TRINITY_DN10262_c0_g5_i1:3-671(-)